MWSIVFCSGVFAYLQNQTIEYFYRKFITSSAWPMMIFNKKTNWIWIEIHNLNIWIRISTQSVITCYWMIYITKILNLRLLNKAIFLRENLSFSAYFLFDLRTNGIDQFCSGGCRAKNCPVLPTRPLTLFFHLVTSNCSSLWLSYLSQSGTKHI